MPPAWRSWRSGTPRARSSPAIDRRLPMAELRAAYARMGSREVQGKLLMVNP